MKVYVLLTQEVGEAPSAAFYRFPEVYAALGEEVHVFAALKAAQAIAEAHHASLRVDASLVAQPPPELRWTGAWNTWVLELPGLLRSTIYEREVAR